MPEEHMPRVIHVLPGFREAGMAAPMTITSPDFSSAHRYHHDDVVRGLREALVWYESTARLMGLNHSFGAASRMLMAEDGGEMARAALAQMEGGEG